MKKFETFLVVLHWCLTATARRKEIRYFDLPTPLKNLTGRHLMIFEGDSIILTCRFPKELGSKATLFYWQTNYVELSRNESTPFPDHYRTIFDHTRYDLEVMKAGRRHSGIYYCTVSRLFWGVTHLETWALEVVRVPKAELKIQPQNLRVLEFSKGNKINCTSKAMKPLPDLQWYRQIGDEWKVMLMVSGQIHNLGTSTTSSTLLFDAHDHDEVFLCIAKGPNNQSISRKANVSVIRTPSSKIPTLWKSEQHVTHMTTGVPISRDDIEEGGKLSTTNITESRAKMEGEGDEAGRFSNKVEYFDRISVTYCILFGGGVVAVLIFLPITVLTVWTWHVQPTIGRMILPHIEAAAPVVV